MPYSENLQFEDGARVGKMETERSRNLQTAALRKKNHDNQRNTLHRLTAKGPRKPTDRNIIEFVDERKPVV